MAAETGAAQTLEPGELLCLIASLHDRLARISGVDAAHGELLAKHIREWDTLLTCPACVSSELEPCHCMPYADVLPRAMKAPDHVPPKTFVDLHECLETVFTFVFVDLFFDLPRFWSGACVYGRVCINFKRSIEGVCRRRRAEQRRLAIEQDPTFIGVEARLGRPAYLWPMPVWRSFKVEVWWFFDAHRTLGTGWHFCSEQWVTRLSEVQRVWDETHQAAGLYTHVQLTVTMWTFDLMDREWAEEDHV